MSMNTHIHTHAHSLSHTHATTTRVHNTVVLMKPYIYLYIYITHRPYERYPAAIREPTPCKPSNARPNRQGPQHPKGSQAKARPTTNQQTFQLLITGERPSYWSVSQAVTMKRATLARVILGMKPAPLPASPWSCTAAASPSAIMTGRTSTKSTSPRAAAARTAASAASWSAYCSFMLLHRNSALCRWLTPLKLLPVPWAESTTSLRTPPISFMPAIRLATLSAIRCGLAPGARGASGDDDVVASRSDTTTASGARGPARSPRATSFGSRGVPSTTVRFGNTTTTAVLRTSAVTLWPCESASAMMRRPVAPVPPTMKTCILTRGGEVVGEDVIKWFAVVCVASELVVASEACYLRK